MRDLRDLRVSDGTEAENREFHAEKGACEGGDPLSETGRRGIYSASGARDEKRPNRACGGAYENLKIDDFFSVNPEEAGCVRLSLRQGIGAPSVPTVKDGDPVKAGERIAACPEKSLGSELHASVSGTVSIDPDGAYIEIRTGKNWSYEKQEP